MGIGASLLAPFPAADAAAAGIEIPQGDPDALRAAARAWADAAELLTARTPVLDGATAAAGLASWSGGAADALMMASQLLHDDMRQTARDAAHAAPVCRRLATAIEHAQDDARAAIADAKDAIERIEDAKHTIEQASLEAAEADHRTQAAQASAQTARGLTGVLGEPAAQIADQRERAARTHGLDARARIQRASAQFAAAESELRRARHRGEVANRAARQAGRTAAAALAEIAGAARRPAHSVRPPVATYTKPSAGPPDRGADRSAGGGAGDRHQLLRTGNGHGPRRRGRHEHPPQRRRRRCTNLDSRSGNCLEVSGAGSGIAVCGC